MSFVVGIVSVRNTLVLGDRVARMLRKEMYANLGFTPSGFTPTFESKLSNQFLTYTNFLSDRFGKSTEDYDDSGDEK